MKDIVPANVPKLAGARERLHDKTSELLSGALPVLARVARDTGQSIATYSAAAGNRTAQALEGRLPAIGKAAVAHGAGTRILRFAARRPVAMVLGGVAIAGLGILLSRKLLARAPSADGAAGSHGDGPTDERTHDGARDEPGRAEQPRAERGAQVSPLSRSATEGREGSGLELAERRDRSQARH